MQCEALKARGYDPTVIPSYLDLKPLLLENVAISEYIIMKQDPDLRQALPEVCKINEAVMLATMEYRLNLSQQEQLHGLLGSLYSPEPPAQRNPDLMEAKGKLSHGSQRKVEAQVQAAMGRVLAKLKAGKLPTDEA